VRLLHVVDTLAPGGSAATSWCRGLGRALVSRGHAVEVLALASRPGPTASGGLDLDGMMRVRRFAPSAPLAGIGRLRRRPARWWSSALRGALLRALPAHDAVHLHGAAPPAARLVWLASRLVGRPVIVTPHLASVPAATATRWIWARADAIVVVAPAEEALLLRERVVPRRLVPSAFGAPEASSEPRVDGWRERLGLGSDVRLVAFAGSMDWGTGGIPFVDAVRLLRFERRSVVAALLGPYQAGDGRPRRLWQAGLVPVVEVPLLCDDERRALLAEADAVVLPAAWHLGAAYEAWAAGVPVLAPSDEGPDEPGVITFPLRDPAALARRLAALLDDAPAAARTVAAGRRRLEEAPSWADVAGQMETLYAALTRRRAPAVGRGSAA
jgi:glycosyltransferase involved in cell wall biosynthesis